MPVSCSMQHTSECRRDTQCPAQTGSNQMFITFVLTFELATGSAQGVASNSFCITTPNGLRLGTQPCIVTSKTTLCSRQQDPGAVTLDRMRCNIGPPTVQVIFVATYRPAAVKPFFCWKCADSFSSCINTSMSVTRHNIKPFMWNDLS